MADLIGIKASARPRAGKGAARAVRREGRIPGVIYGDKKEPQTIAMDFNETWKTIQRGKFLSSVFEIDLDGTKHRVLPRDIQLDPVKDIPIHIDFQRIGADGLIRVAVPVRFINDAASPGLKRGGVLNIVRHEVEVICPADNIPQVFEFDLTGLEIGRSIHISAVQMPPNVRPTISNRDFTVATIAGAVAKTDDEGAAAGAAGAAEGAAPGAAAGDKAAAAKGAPAKGAPSKGAPAADAKGGGKK